MTMILIASLLVSGVAFANEDVRDKIISVETKEVSTKEVAKNELLGENLENFGFDLEIKRIEQTEENVRVVYQFNSFLQDGNTWEEDRKEQVLVIAKSRISDEEELKTYVNNELLEVVEQERFYLRKLQKREQEFAAVEDTEEVIEVSVLSGLFDLSFDAPIESSDEDLIPEILATSTASSTIDAVTVALVPLSGFKSSLPIQPKTQVLAEAGRIGDGEDSILTLDEWVDDVAAAETEEELDAILDIDPETLPSDPETPVDEEVVDAPTTTGTVVSEETGTTTEEVLNEETSTTTEEAIVEEPEEESTILVTTGTTTDETIIIEEGTAPEPVVEEAPVLVEEEVATEPVEPEVAEPAVETEPVQETSTSVVEEVAEEQSTIILTGEEVTTE